MLRGITGIGKGFYISIGDGFAGIENWAGYLPDSDRLILDSHPYFAFDGGINNDPITLTGPDGRPGGIWPQQACGRWAHQLVDRYVHTPPQTPVSLGFSGSTLTIADACRSHSQSAFGVTIAGEHSNGFNDCAFWLRGPANLDTLNPNCAFWTNSAAWNDTVKEGLKNFALASMDSLINPFFWTWKVSLVLKLYLGDLLGAIISLSWLRLTIGVSAFMSPPKQLPRAPVIAIFYLFHTTNPKRIPALFPPLPMSPALGFYRHGFIGPSLSSELPGPCSGDSVPCITL